MSRRLVASAALFAAACTPDPPAAAPAAGWITDVVTSPERFTDTVERDGAEGWVALHRSASAQAYASFRTPVGRARAAEQAAVLFDDLAATSAAAHARLYAAWAERSPPPPTSAAWTVAGLAERCGGAPTTSWAELAAGPGAHLLAAASPLAVESPPEDPFVARYAGYRRAGGDLAAIARQAVDPVHAEPAEGFERLFYDPCALSVLAQGWWARVGSELGGEPRHLAPWSAPDADLATRLFAPWLTPQDAVVGDPGPGELGGHAAWLAEAGVPPADATRTPQQARELGRQVTEQLDGWGASLNAVAPEDGQAVLTDLALLGRLRQQVLVARARAALRLGHPAVARTLATAAIDRADPGIGPTNSADAYVVLARADLASGRSREALDALRRLEPDYPEIRGLLEVVGELAVLSTLDRSGDSKED